MTGLIAGEEELANFVNNPTAEYADKIKALGIIGKEYGFAEVTTGLLGKDLMEVLCSICFN